MNLNKDKKKTTKGNRFIVCEALGSAQAKYIDDKNLIRSSFNFVLS